MNNFCKSLAYSIRDEFEIEVDDFVSKKKKLVHMSLAKPLQAYKFFKDIISFIRNYWNSRKFLCTGYSICYFYFYPGGIGCYWFLWVEFNDRDSASIKSFAEGKRKEVRATTRFMSVKLLMFAKLYLKSFIYDVVETFCFPTEEISSLHKKYLIEKVEVFHVLTYTDSTALKFIFVSDPNSNLPEDKFKDIFFEVIVTSKIYKRFVSSKEFWDTFGPRKTSRQKN